MSMVGSDMAPGVRKELCKRSVLIPDGYGAWTHGRIPWARMTPMVKVGTSTGSSSILMGGKMDAFSEGSGASYRVNKGGTDTKRRNNPRPGIKNMKIEDKGTMGAFRKATIDFVVWDWDKLDIYERFYMSLGTHVLIEWGWSVDSDGNFVSSRIRDLDWKYDSTGDFLCEVRKLQSAHNFSYDALRGLVTNFNWSLNSFGGYDCTVELTSQGNTFLSTSTETATLHSGCPDDPDDDPDDAKKHTPNMDQVVNFIETNLTADPNEPYQNKEAGGRTCYIGIAALFDKEMGAMDTIKSWFSGMIGSGPTNAELDYYVTWDYFEEYIVNRKLAPMYASLEEKGTSHDKSGDDKSVCNGSTSNPHAYTKTFNKWKSKIYRHPRKNNLVYKLDSRGSVLKNHPMMVSADPGVIILPRQEHWKNHEVKVSGAVSILAFLAGWVGEKLEWLKDYFTPFYEADGAAATAARAANREATETRVTEALQDDNVDPTTDENFLKFKPFDPSESHAADARTSHGNNNAGSSGKGLLSNIMINTKVITSIGDEKTSLDEFLDELLNQMSQVTGNLWDLVIVEDPDDPSTVRIIDRNYAPDSNTVQGFHFYPVGRKSICRDVSVETKIDSKMAAAIMYGKNKKSGPSSAQPMGGQSAREYDQWSPDVVDQVYEKMALLDSVGQVKDVDCCNTTKGSNANALDDAWEGYWKAGGELANKVEPDTVEEMITAMRKLMNLSDPSAGLPNESGGGLKEMSLTGDDGMITIPLDVGLTLDGISGLRWGNYIAFKKNSALPARYTRGFNFQIMGVDHEISDKDWTTTVRTVMRPGKCLDYSSCTADQNSGNFNIPGKPITSLIIKDGDKFTPVKIIPKIPDEDDEIIEEKITDQEEILAIPMIGMTPLPTGCPCEGMPGEYSMDCCDGPIEAGDLEAQKIPTHIIEKDPGDGKDGCPCPDSEEVKPECCEEEVVDKKKINEKGKCEDDIKTVTGDVTVITHKSCPCEDGTDSPECCEDNLKHQIGEEDPITGEDCEIWGTFGELIQSGVFGYENWLYRDCFYAEFRRNKSHCFFIDLYMWHGDDKGGMSCGNPVDNDSKYNLWGKKNTFTGAMLNNRADEDRATSVIHTAPFMATGGSVKKKKKGLQLKRKASKDSNRLWHPMWGIPDFGTDLLPGNPESAGLWIGEHIKYFTPDADIPAHQGPGSDEIWDQWANGKTGYWVTGSRDPLFDEDALIKKWITMWSKWNGLIKRQMKRDWNNFKRGASYKSLTHGATSHYDHHPVAGANAFAKADYALSPRNTALKLDAKGFRAGISYETIRAHTYIRNGGSHAHAYSIHGASEVQYFNTFTNEKPQQDFTESNQGKGKMGFMNKGNVSAGDREVDYILPDGYEWYQG